MTSKTQFNAGDMTEAAYSVNFRMVSNGEQFQFTLRDVDEASFVARLNDLITQLKQSGWQFYQDMQPSGASPQQGVVSQSQYRQAMGAVQGTYTAAPSSVPQGTPNTSNQPKLETIEGWVTGTYQDRSGEIKPMVLLYTPKRPYAAYRVYPERASLLPFPFPTEGGWDGSAPDKQTAIARKKYNFHEFQLLVVPETNDDGTLKVNAKGYQQYRIPRVGELQDASPAPGGAAASKVATTAVLGKHDPEQPHDDHALRWTMQDDVEAVSSMQIPSPLDEWMIDVRERYAAISDEKSKPRATEPQFAMLNEWVAGKLKGVTLNQTVEIMGVGSVPLAGLLFGALIDRYATAPTDVPADVAVATLQLIMPMRGAHDNPNYDPNFAENLAEVVRLVYENVSGATPAPF